MKAINTTDLVSILTNTNGATICRLETITEPKMNKKGNTLFGRVTKITKGLFQFGYNYENAVNNRLEKQGSELTFVAESRPFGKWLVPNKVAEHNGNIYIRFYTMSNQKLQTEYLVDGRPATKEETDIINFFTPARKDSAKQAAHGLTENQVKPIEYKVQSIREISIGGELYQVSAEQPTETNKAEHPAEISK